MKCIVAISTLVFCASLVAVSATWTPPAFCNGLDCPVYDVLKTYSTFEIRHYPAQTWSAVNITGTTYQEAVNNGFNLLFQYISGANVNKQTIEMAAPVSVDIFPGAGPTCNTTFVVSFFVPFALQNNPVPPTNPNVYIRTSPDRTVAVGTFGGFISDFNSTILPQLQTLGNALTTQGLAFDQTMETTNDYDSPFKVFNRHNEVWLNLL